MKDCDAELDCLEFLRYVLGCTYVSDLRTPPYNDRARLVIKQLNFEKYSCRQVADVLEYICGENQK